MCGIAGIFGRWPLSQIQSMSALIAKRGPDGGGIFVDGEANIALAHRRLAIIDVTSAGEQPMTDQSGRYTIVFNGEIYNYRELGRDILGSSVRLRGHSDTEVLLECYARIGVRLFERLNGIFALAIWDKVERELTIARDGMGVKPLYVAERDDGIAFASELKALMVLPGLDLTIDRVAAASYLTYLWSPGHRTLVRGIHKMTPGTWRQFGTGVERGGTFYTLPDYDPDPGVGTGDLIQQTAAMIDQAVTRQMMADVEVGAYLSGGLDSSAIVAFARRHAGQSKMRCFTIDYSAFGDRGREMSSDLPYARATARHLDVELEEVQARPPSVDEFADLIYLLDEPQADPAALNNMDIAHRARSLGIKVLLSGSGGDDVFTGYRRHSAAAADRVVSAVPSAIRRLAAQALHAFPVSNTTARRARKLADASTGTRDERLARYFEWMPLEAMSRMLTGPSAGIADDVREPLLRQLATTGDVNAVEKILRLDQRFFLGDHNLNYVDKTGMAHGVEIRVPLLDRDLMSFAARIPTKLKLHRGTTKWIFRKAMEPYLPHSTIYRPKTGFGVPLRTWLAGPLRDMVEELTTKKVIEHRGIFDPDETMKLKRQVFDGTVDGGYSLLGVIAIELWCRKFLDDRHVEPLAGLIGSGVLL